MNTKSRHLSEPLDISVSQDKSCNWFDLYQMDSHLSSWENSQEADAGKD